MTMGRADLIRISRPQAGLACPGEAALRSVRGWEVGRPAGSSPLAVLAGARLLPRLETCGTRGVLGRGLRGRVPGG